MSGAVFVSPFSPFPLFVQSSTERRQSMIGPQDNLNALRVRLCELFKYALAILEICFGNPSIERHAAAGDPLDCPLKLAAAVGVSAGHTHLTADELDAIEAGFCLAQAGKNNQPAGPHQLQPQLAGGRESRGVEDHPTTVLSKETLQAFGCARLFRIQSHIGAQFPSQLRATGIHFYDRNRLEGKASSYLENKETDGSGAQNGARSAIVLCQADEVESIRQRLDQ